PRIPLESVPVAAIAPVAGRVKLTPAPAWGRLRAPRFSVTDPPVAPLVALTVLYPVPMVVPENAWEFAVEALPVTTRAEAPGVVFGDAVLPSVNAGGVAAPLPMMLLAGAVAAEKSSVRRPLCTTVGPV